MEGKQESKIVLPEKTQISMLEFFLKTSIPRKKLQDKQTQNSLSETKKDR